jgi:hypothetical protein
LSYTGQLVVGPDDDPIVLWQCGHQHRTDAVAIECAVNELRHRRGPGRPNGKPRPSGPVEIVKVREGGPNSNWVYRFEEDGRPLFAGLSTTEEGAMEYAQREGWRVVQKAMR